MAWECHKFWDTVNNNNNNYSCCSSSNIRGLTLRRNNSNISTTTSNININSSSLNSSSIILVGKVREVEDLQYSLAEKGDHQIYPPLRLT